MGEGKDFYDDDEDDDEGACNQNVEIDERIAVFKNKYK